MTVPATVQGDLFGRDRQRKAKRVGLFRWTFMGCAMPIGPDAVRQNVMLGYMTEAEADAECPTWRTERRLTPEVPRADA
ncbi:MAG: hypothetical protein ACK5Z1_00320 [Gemmatimonadota bacterium]